jgi:hypothetical protein
MVGMSPRAAAAYEALRLSPKYFSPASGTEIVRGDSAIKETPLVAGVVRQLNDPQGSFVQNCTQMTATFLDPVSQVHFLHMQYFFVPASVLFCSGPSLFLLGCLGSIKGDHQLARSTETPHLRVRIEPKLLARLEKSREKNSRTLTGEIVARLQESFRTDDSFAKLQEHMQERMEDWKGRYDERQETIWQQRKEAQATADKALKDLELQKAEFEQFKRQSEAAIRAATVVEVLLGGNKLKSDLLRLIALKLADVPNDWIASESNGRQLAERMIGCFQKTQAGEVAQ